VKARTEVLNLSSTYLRLRSDATVEPLPVDASFWEKLGTGLLGDFHHEFLVTSFAYSGDWPTWEMHPNGDEIVCLLSGSVTFVLELESGKKEITLSEAGNYVIVPKGTWHTAKVRASANMLFITAGEGTQHRDA
jgi:mannose-6-phosphate isomerase-like protein (cupin superfamily)